MNSEPIDLDHVDRKILEILRQNARRRNTEIAAELGLTEGAIRKRIKRLEALGIIKKYTIEVDQGVQGINALIFVYLKEGVVPDEVIQEIMDIKEIREGWEVTGETDIVIRFTTDAPEKMQPIISRIRRINGVERTVTHVILRHIIKRD